MDPKTLLKNYINRILELQDERQSQEPLTESELRNVAIDLGLDEGELAFLKQQFDDYMQRARGFAKYYNWEDAIEEYKQALTLNPIDRECLEEISNAYYEKWKMSKKEEDKDGAHSYSRRLLDIDPDNEIPLKVISEIRSVEKSVPEPKAPSRPTAMVAIALLGVVVIGFLFFFLRNDSLDTEGMSQQAIDSLRSSAAAKEALESEVPNLAMPVKLSLLGNEKAFQIQILSSKLSDYESSYSYKAYGYVEAMEEIEELKVRATLLDKNGMPILEPKEFTLVQDHQANARPGDLVPWSLLVFEENEQKIPVESVRIEPTVVKKVEGAGTYPDPKLLDSVYWDMTKPNGHELIARERRFNITQSAFIKKAYARVELELENKGQEKYKSLKIRMVWKGKAGQTEGITYALSADFPFLIPGRKIAFGGTFEIGEHIARDFYGYEVHVSEWN